MFFFLVYLYFVVNLFSESNFCWQDPKKLLMKKMTYDEIYRILFWKEKINYSKIIISTKNNLIIVTCSAKQHGAQVCININGSWFCAQMQGLEGLTR
jgi:hypothetical protein